MVCSATCNSLSEVLLCYNYFFLEICCKKAMLLVLSKLEETFVLWCLNFTWCQVILIRRFRIFFMLYKHHIL
jgi:hypothetical protein